MRKSRTNSRATLLAAIVVASLGFGALAYYVQNTPAAKRVPDDQRVNVVAPIRSENGDAPPRPSVTVRIAEVRNGVVRLGESVPVGDGEGPARVALSRTLDRLDLANASIVGLAIKDRHAVIEVNDGFTAGMGSTTESYVIEAFQLALGQFSTVDTFEIQLSGVRLDSLGHFELENPMRVKRPNAAP
ncbi:MAG: hypothetical protein SFX74_03515 [Fimbriimonadaceae bacterium]|nr:hypothetical protein [Fimbriimonadaceae bacterium]